MRIAAQDTVGEALGPLLVGPTAIAFGNDESATAKAVLDATRPYKLVDDHRRPCSATGRSTPTASRSLASLPSREVLLGQARRRDAGADGDAGRPARRATSANLGYALRPGPRPEGRGRGA